MPEFEESSKEEVIGIETSDTGCEVVIAETSLVEEPVVNEVYVEEKSVANESATSKTQERYALKRGRLPQAKKSIELSKNTVSTASVVDVTKDAIGSRAEIHQKPKNDTRKTTEVLDGAPSVDIDVNLKKPMRDTKKPMQARLQNAASKREGSGKFIRKPQTSKKRSKLGRFLEGLLKVFGIKPKSEKKANFGKNDKRQFPDTKKNYRPRRHYSQNKHSKNS